MRRLAALAALGLALAMPACVVVEEKPVRPRGAPAAPAGSASLDGPIARPAIEGRTVNSRVVVGIEPLGTIPYDGQVLPLVSPDGRYVATQVGEAPTWGTLLADRSQQVPGRLWIEVYDISDPAPRMVASSRDLPRGLLLGRSCDARGFLVESPRPDGSRWIGRVGWQTSRVEWLAQGSTVNAFATQTGAEGVVFAQRSVESGDRWKLGNAGAPGPKSVGFAVPSIGPGGDVYALRETNEGVELACWRAASDGRRVGATHVLRARRLIMPNGSVGAVYQATDPIRGASTADALEAPGFLFFDPSSGRMAVFDAETGVLTPLLEGTIGGAWVREGGSTWGVFLTAPTGLMHQRLERRGGIWEAMPPSRVLFDPFVPRGTSNPDRPFVLIGPDQRDGRRLSIMGMVLGGDAGELGG